LLCSEHGMSGRHGQGLSGAQLRVAHHGHGRRAPMVPPRALPGSGIRPVWGGRWRCVLPQRGHASASRQRCVRHAELQVDLQVAIGRRSGTGTVDRIESRFAESTVGVPRVAAPELCAVFHDGVARVSSLGWHRCRDRPRGRHGQFRCGSAITMNFRFAGCR
jgi:hypothetical protein